MARKRKEKSWSEKLNQAGYGSSNNLSQNQRSLTKEGKAKAKSNKSKSGEKVKSAYKNTNINPYSPLSSVSSGSASARAATTGSNKRNAEKNKVYTSHVTDRFKNKVNTTHSNINTKDININPYGKFTKENTTKNYRVNVVKDNKKANKSKNENNTVKSETIDEVMKNANYPYGKFTKENTTDNTSNIEENKKITSNVNKGPKAPINKAVKQIREENESPKDILNPYDYSATANTKGTINEVSKAGIRNTKEAVKAKEARADALVFKSSEEKQKEVQSQINKTGIKVNYEPSEKVLNLYRSGKEKDAQALMQKEYSKAYSKELAKIAAKGKAIKTDGSNAGAYYDKNPVTAILKSGGKQSQAFNAMSEDEKNMAYAVLATQGRDAAAKYLENYRSTAVNEKAVKDFKEFQSGDPNAFDYAVKALKGGFNRAMEGTAQMASKMGGNDNILDSGASVVESGFYNQYLNGLIDKNGNVIKYDTDEKGNLTEKGKEELEKNKNKAGAFAYAAAENIGAMIPTIAMGTAGGGTIGLGMMFTSSYGNSYKEQIENGVDVDTADKYATRDALSEVLTEKFLGGLPIVGNAGGSFSKHILKGLGKVSSNLAENKVIRELIKGTIDEGMEEWIQAGVLSPLNDRFTLGDKNAKIDLLSPEALESALLGSVVGGIFGTVGSTRVIKTRNSVETSVNDLVNNTQNSPNINGITNAKELADNIKLSGIEESIGAKEGTFSELYTKKELGDIFGKENASEYMSEIDSIKDISAPEKVKNKISEYRQAIRDVRAYKESKANNNQSDISPNNNSIVKRDVSEYTKEDTMKRLIQYENSADVNFNGYISEVMNGRVQNSSYRVSPSSQDIRNDIKSLTGIDTGNAEFTMRPSFLKEIVNADNGIENSDITKLNYILNDYDSIERGDNPSYRVTPLVIKKTVGDSVYTAEVIPDNTAGSKGLSVVNLSKEVRETKPVLERENLTAEESIETLEKQGEVDNKELLKVIKAQQKQIEDLNRKLSGETERENKSSKSILKTRGIKKLSEHIANNLKSGKDNLILGYGTTFKNFIQNAVNNKSYNKRLYAGQVSEELAGEINRLYPEHDVRGYIFTIHSRRIIHILNKHGINNANIDEIPVTQKDLLLILEILNKPEGLRKSNYKDASNRDVIFLEKNIGNNARVVMGISKGKKALDLDTFYIVDKQKRKGRHTPNTTKKSSPSNHVRNGMVTPSNDIISQEGGFVNKTKNEKSNYSIQRDNKGSEYVREVKDENGKTTEIIRRDSEKITDSEIEKIKAEYENAADNVVVKFVDKVLKNRKCKFVRYTSKNILNENLRKDIGVLTDNNIDEDYRADWGSSNVIHVYNRHGKNGIADQTMSDIRDISKAEYVLNNYDIIKDTNTETYSYRGKDNKPSKVLLVSKRINGYHHVAFVAPDSKWKKIHILSTYKSKTGHISDNQIKEELSSYVSSKNKNSKIIDTADSSPINNIISQNGEIDTKKNKEPKYSIQRDNRGSEYVRIDTDQDIFEGVKEKDYPRVARKYMQDYLKGELSLNDNDKITINTRGREKYTNPKQGGDYKSEKMRLTPELKNVLKIAEKISEGIPTKENSKYKKWEYYGFKFEIDGKKFKGKINVGIDKGGKKFYDINGISPVGEAAAIATFEANRGHSINNIISQNEKNDTKKNKNSINDNNKEIRQQKGYDEELFSEKGQEFNEENANKYKVPIDYIGSINEISKKVGVEVRFRRLQAKDNGNVIEGMYKNGVIYLDPESNQKINTIFKHELTHYLKNGSKGEYERLEKFVLRTIYSNTEAREALENRINLYMKEVEGFSREDAKEEVLSDFVSEYLFTDKENDMVVRLAREETSLFTRIRDFFKMLKNTFIKYKGSKKARTAGKIQNRIIKAEQMYKRIYDNVVKNGVDTDTGEHVKYHVSRNFESEINKVLDNDLNDNVMIKARDVTPKVLINAGAKNLPMLLAQSHVKQIVYTKEQGEALGLNYDYYHGLGIEGLLEAIDNLDNPTRLFQYTNDKKHFIFETTARDYKGRLVVVPIRLEENGSYNEISIDNNGLEITKNKIIKNNQVKTAFGTDIKKYIDKKVEKGILVEIKKTTSSNSESEGNNPKDYETDKSSSKDIIPQNKKNDTEKHKLSYANEALTEEIPNSFEIAKSRAGNITFKKLPLKKDLDNMATKQSVMGADKILSKQKGAKHQIAALKQNLINDGYAVEKLGKSLRNERMKYYYNTVLHSGKTAEFNVGKYQVDYKGKKVGKSLREIFEPIRDSSDFTYYMLHRLNIDRWKTNKPIDEKTSREKSEMMIKRYEASHPEYIKAAKEVYNYIKNEMQYKVDSGLIDKATKDYLEELYPNYIPVEQIDPYGFRGTKTRHRLSINKPIKEAEGFSGFENITDIDKALVRMTMGTTKNAKINMLLSEFYKEAKKGLTKGEVDIRKVEDISIEDLSDMYDDNLTVLDPGEVVFYDNGKKVTLGVNNPMLFESLTRLNSYKNSSVFDNIFADGLNKAMNVFKKSVTAWDPTFAIRNFFKDIGDALLYAPDFKAFVKQYPTAVKEIVKGIWGGGSELWDLYQSQGGLQETYWGDDSFDIKDRKGIKAGLKVFDLVEQANVLIEQAPRFTEFIDQVRKGGTSYENLTKAMYRADDITVNFNRGGKVVKIANRYFVPFFNPAVQGGDKLIRSLLEQPNGKALAGFMFKGISLGISVMAMNGLIKFIQDRDEDEEEKKKRDKAYSQLNDYVKNSYYLFYMGDGKYLRIPKGRAVSAIGILTNDIYRKAAKGEDVSFLSSEGTFGQMWEQISPLPSGTLISPITDAMNNKNYYGGQLVSDSMQKRKPSEQYDENTDVISKKIGQITNISPKKINYVLKQYSGVGGRLLLPFATPSGLVGKDNAVEGTFKNLTKSFISDTAYSNNISSKYYDVLNDLDQRISAEYDKGNKTYTPAKVVKWYVSNVSEDLNALYGKKKAVLDEDLTNAEKVMKQREIQLKINKLQEESTENILKVEEELNKIYKKKVKKDKEARLYSTDLAKALYKTVGGEKGGKEAIRVLNYKDDEATKHSVKMKKSGVSYKKQAKYYIYYNDIKYKKSKYTGWKKEQLIKKAKTLDIPVSAQMMLIYSTATGFGSNYSIRNEFGYGKDESRNKVYNYLIENKSLSKKEKIKMFEYMGYEVVKENGKYYACW